MPPPSKLLLLAGLLLIAAVFSMSWRWAGNASARAPGISGPAALSSTRGPVDPAFCGPLQTPLPPPSIDSIYGHHLYAASAKGRVHPLPVMEALAQLPPPAPVADRTPAGPSPAIAAPAFIAGRAAGASLAPAGTASPPPHRGEYHETAEEDVQTVVVLLEEYRRAFGAMPMGEQNDEIVRRLQGENPKGIAVLPKNHPNISPDGDLLDRWGTPYRFHPESAWLTTVRSAGPDREMWTADDIISEQTPLEEADALTAGF